MTYYLRTITTMILILLLAAGSMLLPTDHILLTPIHIFV